MNRTITGCFSIHNLTQEIIGLVNPQRWVCQKHGIMSDRSGSGTISSGYFTKTDEEGRCIGGGVEIQFNSHPDPKDPQHDKLYVIFHFPHLGLPSVRVEIVLDVSEHAWTLFHYPGGAPETQGDPIFERVRSSGVTAWGGSCVFPFVGRVMDAIRDFSDLAHQHAND